MTATEPTAFSGRVGVASRDITPPVGIHTGNWGAAKVFTAAGIHRPMTATALAFFHEKESEPLVLIAIDLGWFKSPGDERMLREPLLKSLGIEPARLVFCLSHTHAGPASSIDDAHRPGGHLIAPYIQKLIELVVEAAEESIRNAEPAVLDWKYGLCDLAANRDLVDPSDPEKILVGYNPNLPADTTLLVGRICRGDGSVLAVLVNYACHPTTLAWDNALISPDFVGAMRETVEQATGGLCAFLQGASGDIGPAHGFTDDVAVADRNGRCLAHAVLATIDGMPTPGTALNYAGAIQSGAGLALWKPQPMKTDSTLAAVSVPVDLPLKPQPELAKLQDELARCDDPVMRERMRRRIGIVRFVGSGSHFPMQLWAWRIGGALLFAQANEMYSAWQIALRRQWPNRPVVAINVANGSCGYLVPRPQCCDALYAYWQTPFAIGGFEAVEKQSIECGRELLNVGATC